MVQPTQLTLGEAITAEKSTAGRILWDCGFIEDLGFRVAGDRKAA